MILKIIELKYDLINKIIFYLKSNIDSYIKLIQFIPDYCYDKNDLLKTEIFIRYILFDIYENESDYYYCLYRTEDDRECEIKLSYEKLISLLKEFSLIELQFIYLQNNEKN